MNWKSLKREAGNRKAYGKMWGDLLQFLRVHHNLDFPSQAAALAAYPMLKMKTNVFVERWAGSTGLRNDLLLQIDSHMMNEIQSVLRSTTKKRVPPVELEEDEKESKGEWIDESDEIGEKVVTIVFCSQFFFNQCF